MATTLVRHIIILWVFGKVSVCVCMRDPGCSLHPSHQPITDAPIQIKSARARKIHSRTFVCFVANSELNAPMSAVYSMWCNVCDALSAISSHRRRRFFFLLLKTVNTWDICAVRCMRAERWHDGNVAQIFQLYFAENYRQPTSATHKHHFNFSFFSFTEKVLMRRHSYHNSSVLTYYLLHTYFEFCGYIFVAEKKPVDFFFYFAGALSLSVKLCNRMRHIPIYSRTQYVA